MGLLGDTSDGRRMTDPAPGRALVVEVNDWLLETRTPYTLRATLVVEAAGRNVGPACPACGTPNSALTMFCRSCEALLHRLPTE